MKTPGPGNHSIQRVAFVHTLVFKVRCTRCLLSFPSIAGPWVITARPRCPELGNARTEGNRAPLGSRGESLGGSARAGRARKRATRPGALTLRPACPRPPQQLRARRLQGRPARSFLPPPPAARPLITQSAAGGELRPGSRPPCPRFSCQSPRWSLRPPPRLPRSSGPSPAWASCKPADGQRSRPWEPIANHENPGPGDPTGRGRRREPLPSSDGDVLPAGPPLPHHTLGEARRAPVRSLQSPLPNS